MLVFQSVDVFFLFNQGDYPDTKTKVTVFSKRVLA